MKKSILFLGLMVFAETVLAMQCIPEPVEKYYKIADFVFEATVIARTKISGEDNVISRSDGESCGPKIANVTLGRAWKGKFQSSATSIYSGDGCYCLGAYFKVGEKYLVFGKNQPKKL